MTIAAYLMAKGQVGLETYIIPQKGFQWFLGLETNSILDCKGHSIHVFHVKSFSLSVNGLWKVMYFSYFPLLFQEVDTPDLNGQTALMLAAQKIIG